MDIEHANVQVREYLDIVSVTPEFKDTILSLRCLYYDRGTTA